MQLVISTLITSESSQTEFISLKLTTVKVINGILDALSGETMLID